MHAAQTSCMHASQACLEWRVQGQVQTAVRKLLARYADEVTSISTTGHSLGGALASLCAFDLVRPRERRRQPASVRLLLLVAHPACLMGG